MKTSNEERKRRILFKPKNEKGSVTVFVLIAMLFFLTVGIIIFITNMNNSANQKKDTSKIQKDYDNVSSGNLNTIYDEQEAKVTGSIQIIVRDSEGNLYKDGVWTNKEPLTIEVVWPKEIKNNAPNGTRQIVIMRGLTPTTYNENQIENVLLSQDGTYNIFAQVNDNKAQVTVRIDHSDPNAAFSPNGGRLFVDPDNHKLIDTVQITASDEYSGVKTVEYLISTSATEPAANDENWKNYTAAIDEIPNVEDGEFYYIYAKVTDNAGNVKIEKSKEYTAVIANYEIKKGDNIQYAETLKEAVDNAATGSTIKLLRDYTDESNVTVKDNKSIVFDNNGKTLTKTTAAININAGATLEVAGNGTITTSDNINIFMNYGTLNITHTGTISNTSSNGGRVIENYKIFNKIGIGTLSCSTNYTTIGNYGANAVATLSAGTINHTGLKGAVHTYNDATTNVSGTATVISVGTSITVGSSDTSGFLNITGGTITASAGPGISVTSGTVTIGTSEGNAPNNENPSITGSTYGVEITTGALNYYSGKIVGTQTTTVKGREVAFKINDESKVTYRTGYGAHTTKEGNIYTTTLSDDYTVTLDANGSTIPTTTGWTNAGDNKTATKVIKYNNAYGTLPQPTRAGYTFKGWNGKNLLNPAELISGKNIALNDDGYYYSINKSDDPRAWSYSNSNIKLRLSTGTYKLSFNFLNQVSITWAGVNIRDENNNILNANYGDMVNKEKYTISFTLTEDTNVGIMLKLCDGVANIQLEKADTATAYEPYYITAETIMSRAEDHTLTAIWEIITYTIGYTLNGGTVTTENPTTYNVETATFTLNNPTRAGYTFTGWTGSNGNTPQTTVTIPKGSTGNRTYTANWQIIPYTISYELNGGTVSPANPTTYNIETATFTLNNPTKTNYVFLGWTGTNGETRQTTVTIEKGSQGNRTYTAHWGKLTLSKDTIFVKTSGAETIAKEGTVAASTAQVTYTVEGTDALDFTSQNTDVATVETTDNVTATVTGIGVTDGGTTKIIFIDKTTGVKLGELNVKIDITPPDWLINFVSIIRGESTT